MSVLETSDYKFFIKQIQDSELRTKQFVKEIFSEHKKYVAERFDSLDKYNQKQNSRLEKNEKNIRELSNQQTNMQLNCSYIQQNKTKLPITKYGLKEWLNRYWLTIIGLLVLFFIATWLYNDMPESLSKIIKLIKK